MQSSASLYSAPNQLALELPAMKSDMPSCMNAATGIISANEAWSGLSLYLRAMSIEKCPTLFERVEMGWSRKISSLYLNVTPPEFETSVFLLYTVVYSPVAALT